MRCKVADEPVVVMKFRPVKPGNGVEDKIETTRWFLAWRLMKPKAHQLARGRSDRKSVMEVWEAREL